MIHPLAPTINVAGPRDLPGLRTHLRRAWDGLFDTALQYDKPRLTGNNTAQWRTRPEWERHALDHAQLLWVTPALTDVIDDLRDTLPADTTMDPADAPWPSGMVTFARRLRCVAIDATREDPLWVRTIIWSPVRIDAVPEYGMGPSMAVGISSYDAPLETGPYDESAELTQQDVLRMWLPLGRSDWCVGDAVDTRFPWMVGEAHDKQQRSFEEDRRLLYTVWRLMGEESIVRRETVTRSKKAKQRGSRKAKNADVVVADLRGSRVPRDHAEGEGRTIGVRHLVRAHWRQQACGPGRLERRPTLIGPHWRGPEDGVVRVSEKVWTL